MTASPPPTAGAAGAIVLIGLPFAGKSTVGRAAAAELGIPFLDTDDLIRDRVGGPFAHLVAEDPHGFRGLEETILLAVPPGRRVVATGGSAVHSAAGMAHLARIGVLVHLALGLDEMRRRARDLPGRGILMPQGATLAALHAERAPLYRRHAQRTVCADRLPDALATVLAIAREAAAAGAA